MGQNRFEKKKRDKGIARARISYLFCLAEAYALKGTLNLSDRYVSLARCLSMKYLVPIPVEYKRRFCTHCYHYMLPAKSCRVRIHRGMIITYCMKCKKYSRIPFHDRSQK